MYLHFGRRLSQSNPRVNKFHFIYPSNVPFFFINPPKYLGMVLFFLSKCSKQMKKQYVPTAQGITFLKNILQDINFVQNEKKHGALKTNRK